MVATPGPGGGEKGGGGGGGGEWGWHLSEPRLLLRVFEGYKCGYNHAVSQVQVENEVALKLLS